MPEEDSSRSLRFAAGYISITGRGTPGLCPRILSRGEGRVRMYSRSVNQPHCVLDNSNVAISVENDYLTCILHNQTHHLHRISHPMPETQGYLSSPKLLPIATSLFAASAAYHLRREQRKKSIQKQPQLLRPCVVLIKGFPGVGKFTVARSLFNALDPSRTRLVDNHLLIDPVEAIAPGRNAAHYTLRRTFRRAAFDALKTLDADTTIVITSCLASNPADADILAEHVEIAQARNVSFVLINMTCGRETHMQRVQSVERMAGTKTKLRDVRTLKTIMMKHKLVNPKDFTVGQDSIAIFDLDTTGKSESELADQLLDLIKDHIGTHKIT